MSHIPDITALFPSQIQNSFEKNELAFLSLTTKIEHPLRDKVAWLLNKQFEKANKPHLVIREWKRQDLVIMNTTNQEFESIIEFKMQLGFKIEHDEYKKDLCRDLYKSALTIRDKAEGNMEKSEILFIMFGRTLDARPAIDNPNVLQAMPYIRGAYNDCIDYLTSNPIIYQEQFENFKDDWEYWLDQACIPKNKKHWLDPIDGGSFLGLGDKIITSIIGPFSAQEVFDLNENCWKYPVLKGKLDTPETDIKREKYMKSKKTIRNYAKSPKLEMSSVEGKIPQEVIDLATERMQDLGRNIEKSDLMKRHYKILFTNGDDVKIIRQNNPNAYEVVGHVLIETNPNRYTKDGTYRAWIERGSDGKWGIHREILPEN